MQIQWKPTRYYGQFILSQTITQSVIFLLNESLQLYDHPVNTAIFSWPVGERLSGFHCSCDSNLKYILNYLVFVVLVTQLNNVNGVEKYSFILRYRYKN